MTLTLTTAELYGTYYASVADTAEDSDTDPQLAPLTADVVFTPAIDRGLVEAAVSSNVAIGLVAAPIPARIVNGVLVDNLGSTDVTLHTFIERPLRYVAEFSNVTYSGMPLPGGIKTFKFGLPADPARTNLVDVHPATEASEESSPSLALWYVRRAEEAAEDASGSASAAAGSASAAAGSASAASSSASNAAASATSAESSATAASGSAGDAAGSATAAAGSASAAANSATVASQGAQIITDNLDAIESAPDHAAAAQVARTGAEDARNAASGSATDAADSASDAAGSATAAEAARDEAVTARTVAESARDAAAESATAAGSARNQAESARDAAAGHAGSASSHASDAADSAAAASGSEAVATQKASDAALSASDAAAALAQVLVELSNTQAYQDVVTAIGDMSSSWNADIQAALADMIGQAPETLDSIQEIATALGNDPNFYTTVMTAIGERVKNDDSRLTNARTPTAHTHPMSEVDGLGDALDGKSNTGHSHTWEQVTGKPGTFPSTIALVAGLQAALDGKSGTGHSHAWGEVTGKPSTFPPATHSHTATEVGASPTGHKHPVSDMTATGTASSSTYLRGDGTWATPTNSTYAVPTQAEAEAGTATTARAFSAQRVRQAANAAIAANEWFGTQAQYDALGTKDPNRTYNILEG